MTRRHFAFGCSYSLWYYATVNDFVGVNFDEHRNLGIPGADHRSIMEQIQWADEQFKFTDQDFVSVNTTSFGRFQIWDPSIGAFIHKGDMWPIRPEMQHHPRICRLWAEQFESAYFSVYRSLEALKNMRTLLAYRGVPHRIYGGVSNLHYQGLDPRADELIEEFYSLLDIAETVDFHSARTRLKGERRGYLFKDGYKEDWHPNQTEHYRYFRDYFPEFDTEKSREFYHRSEEIFTLEAKLLQEQKWNDFTGQFLNFIEAKNPKMFQFYPPAA